MAKRGRDSKHNAVATAGELTTANGMRGDIITSDDGEVGIVTNGAVKVVGQAAAGRALPVRAAILSITSPAFTLGGSNNTLTANANGALGTYLGLGYAMPVGSVALVSVQGAADGIWSVSTEGDGSTPAVLTRSLSYRTAASLPELVALVPPVIINGRVPYWALQGTPPTPGAGALGYYRIDQEAYDAATNVEPDAIAAASLLGSSQMRIAQVGVVDVTSATNDTPLVVPYACTLVSAWGIVSTIGGVGSAAVLRTAAGGGGTALATISTVALGGAFEGVTAGVVTPRVLAAGTYYLNRSDTVARGGFYFQLVRN